MAVNRASRFLLLLVIYSLSTAQVPLTDACQHADVKSNTVVNGETIKSENKPDLKRESVNDERSCQDEVGRLREENGSLSGRLSALESKMERMEKRWRRLDDDSEQHRIKISESKNKITILKGEVLQDLLILSDRLKATTRTAK